MSRNPIARPVRPHLSHLPVRRVGIGLLLAAALVLGGSWTAAEAQEGPIRIAVVDLEIVVANSKYGKDLQTKLEKFQQDAQAEMEVMGKAAADIRQRLAEGVNSLNDDKLAELQKNFEDKQIELRRFRDDKQREGQKLQSEGLKEIEQQLKPVFEKIRDENGYDLILNNVPGVVVMANERVDITKMVIDRLNAPSGG